MKKLIAIIAILALVTTVFATESDPSETVGFVKYSCVTAEGSSYNFIGLPLDAGYTMASDLGIAIGSCDAVTKWDASGQGWGQQASLWSGTWYGDFALESGHAYMINVTSDVDVYIAGELTGDPTFNLVTAEGSSYNFIMVPLSMSGLANASDLGNDIGSCDAVTKWDASGQGWGQQASLWSGTWYGDFDIDIGMPLMVNVTSDVTWPSSEVITNSKNIKVQKSVNQSKEVRFNSERR